MRLRKFVAFLAVCVLLCGMLPLSVTAGADKYPLKNGDFEAGTLRNWRYANGVSISKEAAYTGEYGCLITSDGGWGDLLSQTFSVLPGYTYTLSFWYKADPMGVSWYLFDGDQDGTRLQRGWAGNTTWTQVTTQFTATEDTVFLLYRSSGSHVAEYVYLDCVTVVLNPCTLHTYDNACDTICNICDELREVGDHFYDYDCDISCNECGFERPSSGNHTYDYPCSTLCSYCGAEREGEDEHTYSHVCDTMCDFCGEQREVPHFYDDIYDADCNQCGAVRIPTPKPMERLTPSGSAISYDVSGVAFRFNLDTEGAEINYDNSYVTRSALVYRYNNGVGYKLVRMGAIMSNKKNSVLDMAYVDGDKVIDVRANYLCKAAANSISFAVRIINIPDKGYNTVIFARPYYIYSDGKEEIIVYGETVSQSFNGIASTLD